MIYEWLEEHGHFVCEEDRRKANKLVQYVKNQEEAKYPKGKAQFPCMVQEKHDGVHCIIVILKNREAKGAKPAVGFFTRTGNKMTNVEHLESRVANEYHEVDDEVFFAELCHDGWSLEDLSGMIKHTRKKPIPEGAMDEAYLALFDGVSLEDWIAGESGNPYRERYAQLKVDIEVGFPAILPVTIWAEYRAQVDTLFEAVKARGGEGVVRKLPKEDWVAGKKDYRATKEVVGVDFDLEVVDVIEGKGKRAGTTGALKVRFREYGKPDGKVVYLEVDGRFDDGVRADMWDNKERVIGKIVHVHGLCIGSKGSIRLAKIRAFRIDKTEGDF